MASGSILDRLRILVAVADAGSFSAAGRRLGRARSAVGQAVATEPWPTQSSPPTNADALVLVIATMSSSE